MIEPSHIEAIRDSISATVPLLRQLAENSNPEPYTIENIVLTKFNIVISILALVCSLAGAYYGWKGYLMSKLTAVNVERIKPSTQKRLIIEYFRYVLTSYLRMIVIEKKSSDNEFPTKPYVNSLTLPPIDDYYQIDRFEQFAGCKIFRSTRKFLNLYLTKCERKSIEDRASKKATLEIKRMAMDIRRFDDLAKLMLANREKNEDATRDFCNTLTLKLNDIMLRNLVILSFIDENKMCQCNYSIGRSSVLDYLYIIDNEIVSMTIEKDKIEYWQPVVNHLFKADNNFFYKLLNNRYFDVENYLSYSEKWKVKGVRTKEELKDYLIMMMSKLLVSQSKFY